MKAITSVIAALTLLSSTIASPLPDTVTIGHWTGSTHVSVEGRAAEPEPARDLSPWTGSTHVSVEGRAAEPDTVTIGHWTGATHVSVEGRAVDLSAWHGALKVSVPQQETA